MEVLGWEATCPRLYRQKCYRTKQPSFRAHTATNHITGLNQGEVVLRKAKEREKTFIAPPQMATSLILKIPSLLLRDASAAPGRVPGFTSNFGAAGWAVLKHTGSVLSPKLSLSPSLFCPRTFSDLLRPRQPERKGKRTPLRTTIDHWGMGIHP